MTETCPSCPSHHPTGSLHDYQVTGVAYLRGRPKSVLMLDMGLGKTACVLAAAEPRHLPMLVCAPKRVAEETWDVEAARWRPDLSVAVAKGDPTQRRAALKARADIAVISRDNLGDVNTNHLAQFRTFVVDELSGFKTKSSRRWRTARRIIANHEMAHVWGLTGTPAPNGYLDLWGQIALLDGGKRLGPNLTTYRNRYFQPKEVGRDGTVYSWEPRPYAVGHIKDLLQDICLAMKTEGRITLPPVNVNQVWTDLPPDVRDAYDEFEREMIVDLREIFDGEVHTAAHGGALTSRLSQMSAGFLYVDDAGVRDNVYTHLHDNKWDALAEIVDSPHEGGILVGYRYTAERDLILKRLPQAATPDTPGVFKAWDRGEVPMLVAHPASVGHGLNLQHGGHTIVWTQPTWDLELWDQFNKRLARQGQPHPVAIHVLLGRGTVDPKVLLRCETKSDVQQDLLAFLESPV